uniref:Uncharacterized protein n=1 Tax=Acrobeloides nanus TaxID=290746 RepID=A0A914C426_9BILA
MKSPIHRLHDKRYRSAAKKYVWYEIKCSAKLPDIYIQWDGNEAKLNALKNDLEEHYRYDNVILDFVNKLYENDMDAQVFPFNTTGANPYRRSYLQIRRVPAPYTGILKARTRRSNNLSNLMRIGKRSLKIKENRYTSLPQYEFFYRANGHLFD